MITNRSQLSSTQPATSAATPIDNSTQTPPYQQRILDRGEKSKTTIGSASVMSALMPRSWSFDHMHLWFLSSCIFIVACCTLIEVAFATDPGDPSQFFYIESSHVNEYRASNYPLDNRESAESDRHPGFLYSDSYPNARVVEFYADWCPHCKHFKDSYMKFADQFSSSNRDIEFWGVSCVPNQVICHDFGIHGYPSVFVFPAHTTNHTKIEHFNLHPFQIYRAANIPNKDNDIDTAAAVGMNQQQQIKNGNKNNDIAIIDEGQENVDDTLKEDSFAVPSKHQQQQQIQRSSQYQHFMTKTQQDVYNDAYLSLEFLLKTSVFEGTEVTLPMRRKLALQKFIKHLYKLLSPASKPTNFFDLLHDFLGCTEFTSGTITEPQFMAIVDRHSLGTTEWSPACQQHDSPYTCGLWHLFHIYTIGIVEYNENAILDPMMALESADVLKNLIEQFFGCDDCRQHFVTMYNDCSMYQRCDRLNNKDTDAESVKQLPLWLFDVHNGVNRRLRDERNNMDQRPGLDGTDLDDENEKDVVFPPKSFCSKCWNDDGDTINQENVYKYLRLYYWADNNDSKARQYRKDLGLNVSNTPGGGGMVQDVAVSNSQRLVEPQIPKMPQKQVPPQHMLRRNRQNPPSRHLEVSSTTHVMHMHTMDHIPVSISVPILIAVILLLLVFGYLQRPQKGYRHKKHLARHKMI